MTVTETIQREIDRAKVTRYAIAKAAGVDQATLSRFVRGKSDLHGSTIDALASYFGLELRAKGKTRKAR